MSTRAEFEAAVEELNQLRELAMEMARRVQALESNRRCTECRRWDDGTQQGWKAYLTDDEPASTALFCPECAEREFGGDDA